MSFESPLSKKRSLFSLGTSSTKKTNVATHKKKLPPSGSSIRQRKLSLFGHSKHKAVLFSKVTESVSSQEPEIEVDLHPKPLFQDDTSPTGTMSTMSNSTISNNIWESVDPPEFPSVGDGIREKVKEMSPNTKPSDLLLEQVKVLEAEGQKKDEKLRVLNDKLHGIQRGLAQIDEERTSLQQQVEKLEEEKHDIQKQLDLREKEILTLVKRCSSQEDRMREATQLRCKNNELMKEVEALRNAMSERVKYGESLDGKDQELKDCREALARVKKEHDALANTLHNCLANIKTLTQEKHEWCDERRRILNRAELDLEKQRLQHVGDMNELKISLQSRQDKIDQLENFLKDKATTNAELRKENIELNRYKIEIGNMIEDYEQRISGLTKNYKENLLQLQKQLEDSDGSLSFKVKEKEEHVIQLESEVAMQMEKLMTAWSTVDVLQEESEELEAKLEALEAKSDQYDAIEQERSALRDHCATVHQHLQDLTAEIINLQMDHDNLLEEKKELERNLKRVDRSSEKLRSLGVELMKSGEVCASSEQVLRKQMNDLVMKWESAQEELAETKVRLTESQEKLNDLTYKYVKLELGNSRLTEQAESLRKTLEAGGILKDELLKEEQVWLAREQELQKELDSLNKRKKEMQQTLETKLDESKMYNDDLRQQLQSQEVQVLTYRKELQETKRSEADAMDQVQSLHEQLCRTQAQCDQQTVEEKGLRTLIETIKTELVSIKRKTEVQLSQSIEFTNGLEQQLTAKDSLVASIKSDLGSAERLMCEKNDAIDCLKTELSCVRMSCDEEVKNLEVDIQQLQSQLTLKCDEIQELRKYRTSADDQVMQLQQALATKVAGTSEVEKSLKSKLQEQTARENHNNDILRKSKELVDNLRATVITLTKDKDELGQQLQQQQSSIASLTRKNSLLQQSEKNIRAERDLLILSENESEAKTRRLQGALQREISLKETSLRELQGYYDRISLLESELFVAQQRMKDYLDEKSHCEEVLQERTDLLGEMVNHNKDIQEQLEKKKEMLAVSKNEITQLHVELTEREEELVHLKNELSTREDHLANSLIKERNLREIAESELKDVCLQLNSMRQGSKDVSTLEKENVELKSKVRRQEAFLKRKIHKEKVLRDRSGSTKNTLSTPAVKRRSSPTKPQSAVAFRTRSGDAADSNCTDAAGVCDV